MEPVEEIKSRLSIEDVVGRYVDLKRSGSSLKGLCPFHQEKTPSFYVTPSRGSFHCFGCGKGGDIFSFTQEIERLTFPEALKRLADQAGVTLPEREAQKPSLKNRLYQANEAAARYFAEALAGPGGERARTYLENRRFAADAITTFGLGYAPAGRDGLVRRLKAEGFDDRIVLAAGLALQDEIGGSPRDRFRARLIFPIRDVAGKISGFGGRILDDGQPKYLNSPQTEIFDKSSVLYGVHRANEAIRRAGTAVLVEGYLDAVRAHVSGRENVVASLGTAVTTQQLLALSRLTGTVVLALDPDPAGQAAATRTSLNALAELTRMRGRTTGASGALDLRIARLPLGAGDPDELIRDDPERWDAAIEAAIPAFEFYFTHTLESLDRTGDGWRQEAIDRLVPVIQQFSVSAGWQAIWIERLAAETGIEARALQRAMPGAEAPRTRPRPARDEGGQTVVAGTTSRGLTADPEASIERALMALLLKIVILPSGALESLEPIEIARSEHRSLLDALFAWQQTENYDYAIFRETLPEELAVYADELRNGDVPLPDDGAMSLAVAFHLARLHHFRLQGQLERSRHILDDIPAEDRPSLVAEVAQLMERRHESEQDLDRLSRLVFKTSGARAVYGTIDQDSGN